MRQKETALDTRGDRMDTVSASNSHAVLIAVIEDFKAQLAAAEAALKRERWARIRYATALRQIEDEPIPPAETFDERTLQNHAYHVRAMAVVALEPAPAAEQEGGTNVRDMFCDQEDGEDLNQEPAPAAEKGEGK